jgi:hypothetical protein
MDYPEMYIKGIPNEQCFDEFGIPITNLYDFKENANRVKNDNFKENSINWYDNDEALFQIFTQIKNEEVQFKEGAVILPRNEIDHLKVIYRDIFDYERNELDGNPYHGNLLLKNHVKPATERVIRGAIAAHFHKILKREEIEHMK